MHGTLLSVWALNITRKHNDCIVVVAHKRAFRVHPRHTGCAGAAFLTDAPEMVFLPLLQGFAAYLLQWKAQWGCADPLRLADNL